MSTKSWKEKNAKTENWQQNIQMEVKSSLLIALSFVLNQRINKK